MKRNSAVVLLAMALLLLTPAAGVQAQFKPSVAAFYGNATLDGAAVADGTEVSAWIAKSGALEQVATTTTPSSIGKSTYIIKIVQPTGDDYEGKTIEFHVGAYIATPTAKWEAGGSTSLDLVGSTKAKPAATPVPAATPLPPVAAATPMPPKAVTVAIELYKGWNLIGVPREVDLSKADTAPMVRDSGGYKAWYYWPADGNYYGANYLYPGLGYWVDSSERYSLHFPDGQTSDVTLSITKGWNLISVPMDLPADLLDKQVGINSYDGYKALYYYSGDGKYYGSNNLTAGWGYWIEAQTSGQVLIPLTKGSIRVP